MDLVKLINEVKKYKLIYMKNRIGYTNKKKRDYAWNQISAALNVDVNICRKRWKSLRDRYVRINSQGEQTYWPLYRYMHFLKPVVNTKETETELNENHNESDGTTIDAPEWVTDDSSPKHNIHTKKEFVGLDTIEEDAYQLQLLFFKFKEMSEKYTIDKSNFKHQNFIEVVKGLLNCLSEYDQKDAKMYILNYLNSELNKY